MRKRVLIAGIAVCLLGAWIVLARLMESSQPMTNAVSPSSPQEVTLVNLKPGQQACLRPVEMPAETGVAQFKVGTFGKPGPPLRFSFKSGNQRVSARVGPGYPDNSPVNFKFPEVNSDTLGTACVRNVSRFRVALYGSKGSGRFENLPSVSIDSRPIKSDVVLLLFKARDEALLKQVPDMLTRAARFKPGIVTTGGMWVLMAAVVFVVPGAALWGIGRAFSEDKP